MCVHSFDPNSTTSRCLHGFLHPVQHVYVQYAVISQNCMLFGYMKGSGVSDVDLFYQVSCFFAWLSFPWEKERLRGFQLIMLSSISRVHAHKWHFQECCLNLQRTKNERNSKSESTLQANINQVKWELLKDPWSAEK